MVRFILRSTNFLVIQYVKSDNIPAANKEYDTNICHKLIRFLRYLTRKGPPHTRSNSARGTLPSRSKIGSAVKSATLEAVGLNEPPKK